jgi:Ethylbenzene dehydrogenase/Prokaryotic cytochrome b561
MARRTTPKTDFGTVILHWVLVGLLAVSVATGLRISTVSPFDFQWLQVLDELLPDTVVWTAHMPAALSLFGVLLAYIVYVRRAGLTQRIRPDRARLIGLVRGGQARWSAVNIILTWVLLLTLLLQVVTGFLMYLGHGGRVVELHRFGMWMLIAGAAGHVATHLAIGGVWQLIRIFRPSRLPKPAPPLDPYDLIAETRRPAERQRPGQPRHEPPRRAPDPQQRPRREATLQSHPFVAAIVVGLVGITMATVVDQTAMRDGLHIQKVTKSVAPVLDGDLADPVWRSARPVTVLTNQGANFDGTGASEVEVKAVHDGEIAYFSIVWSDPTRSLKHLPLIKKADGWHVVQSKYDFGDENEFHEDKFSVLLARNGALLGGDRAFHAGKAPVAGKPATFSGRGLHYTIDGSIVDVWQWKATRGGLLGHVDDGHFGPPAAPGPEEIAGRSPYRGGFAPDPGTANYAHNFEQRGPGGYGSPVRPKRLPADWQQTWSAMGRVNGISPGIGESEGARWWMTEAESVAYSPELDAHFPINALIPGVIIGGEYSGDRADIRAASRWAAGRWTLEIARRLDTKSPYDVAIVSGVLMQVAAFDHSQIRHTRHIRPIRLEVE